jgi:dinuclear metal center YbgI/SA1388 family protein
VGSWTVASVLRALDERAPFAKAASWDPVGLQLGDPQATVTRLGLCHEVGEGAVVELERARVDLLIAYHPLLFTPTTRWLAGATPQGRALRLARAGIALAALHTNYDAAPHGCAEALAEALDLDVQRAFAPLWGAESRKLVTFVPEPSADTVLAAVAAAGAAQVGLYTHCSFRSPGVGTFLGEQGTSPVVGERGTLQHQPELRIELVVPADREDAVIAALVAAHPYEEPAYDLYERRGEAGMAGRLAAPRMPIPLGELAERVRVALGAPHARVAGDLARRIERVAVLPGSGDSFLAEAAALGAQVVVTGDVDHHRARAALDRGLALIDPGHVPSERPGLRRLHVMLESLGLPVTSFLHLDPDPWNV